MKFLCLTEFVHSGVALYYEGKEYPLTEAQATELVKLDKKKKLGALSYFSPTDDEAKKFIAKFGGKSEDLKLVTDTEVQRTEGEDKTPEEVTKEPTRAELIEKAKVLGIETPHKKKTDELKKLIEEAQPTV